MDFKTKNQQYITQVNNGSIINVGCYKIKNHIAHCFIYKNISKYAVCIVFDFRIALHIGTFQTDSILCSKFTYAPIFALGVCTNTEQKQLRTAK